MPNRFNSVVAAVICTTLLGTAAGANPLSITKDAGTGLEQVNVRVKAGQISKIKLNNGSVRITANDISVGAVPDWLFDRHTVMTGKIINHKIDTVGGKTSLTGLAYFLDGDWIKELPDVRRRDTIQFGNGQSVIGRVRNFTTDSLDFELAIGRVQRYKLSDIATIDSPRAFTFSIPVQDVKVDPASGSMTAEASQISFNAPRGGAKPLLAFRGGRVEEPKSTLTGTEGGVTKSYIGSLVGLDMANTFGPPIVAALVLPYSWQQARNIVRQVDINTQLQGAQPAIPFKGDVRIQQLQAQGIFF